MNTKDNPEWRDVVGFEGRYKISSDGQIYSLLRNKILSPFLSDGYWKIHLLHPNKIDSRKYFVHRLVAAAFLGVRPDNYVVNHKDGQKQNNCYNNLEYCTSKENTNHATNNGLRETNGQSNGNSVLTKQQVLEIKQKLCKGEKTCAIARQYKVNHTTVSSIKMRRTWAWL